MSSLPIFKVKRCSSFIKGLKKNLKVATKDKVISKNLIRQNLWIMLWEMVCNHTRRTSRS